MQMTRNEARKLTVADGLRPKTHDNPNLPRPRRILIESYRRKILPNAQSKPNGPVLRCQSEKVFRKAVLRQTAIGPTPPVNPTFRPLNNE
jgi:hypothetical protein